MDTSSSNRTANGHRPNANKQFIPEKYTMDSYDVKRESRQVNKIKEQAKTVIRTSPTKARAYVTGRQPSQRSNDVAHHNYQKRYQTKALEKTDAVLMAEKYAALHKTPSPEKDIIAIRRRIIQASAEKLKSPACTLRMRLGMNSVHKRLRRKVEEQERQQDSPDPRKIMQQIRESSDNLRHTNDREVVSKQPEPESPFVVKQVVNNQTLQKTSHNSTKYNDGLSQIFQNRDSKHQSFASGTLHTSNVHPTWQDQDQPDMVKSKQHRHLAEASRDPRKYQASHWIIKAVKAEGRGNYTAAFTAYATGKALGAEPQDKLEKAMQDFEFRMRNGTFIIITTFSILE